jgi:phosphoribosyl 1,2-cyclic phosphodiesterase
VSRASDCIRAPRGKRISFRVSILASGSAGNCTLLESGCTTLLVDAGLGKKEMLRRFETLGRARPEKVDGILVTHEHSDHSSGLAQMTREWNCPAYLTEPTHRKIVSMYTEDPEKPSKKAQIDRVEYIRAGWRFQIGDIEVNPFSVTHDADEPVAFTFRTNGTKVAIVTDLGCLPLHVKVHLREVDFLMIESNHDLDKLKAGPYPWHIKQRVMSNRGHLSNKVVSEFFADPDAFDARARYVVLAHLSEQNNDPYVAEISAKEALGRRPGEFAFRGTLHVASQRIPLGPFDL